MTFKEKLKKVSPNVKEGSLRLYLQNVRRLYRIGGGEGELPDTGSWLGKETLWAKLRKIPVNVRRHISLAGLKAAYAYKINEKLTKKWYGQMVRDSSTYQTKRSENKASDAEKKLVRSRFQVCWWSVFFMKGC